MGFVEWYTIVIFCMGLGLSAYYTGAGGMPENNSPPFVRFCFRWIGILPITGRAFGWW